MVGPTKRIRREIINAEDIAKEIICDSDSDEDFDLNSDEELRPVRDARFSDSEDNNNSSPDTGGNFAMAEERRKHTVPPFTVPPSSLDKNAAPTISNDSSPLRVFSVFL
jgi:hypothetical protein